MVIILSVSISLVVVSTTLFTSLYFVLWRNRGEEETGFHVYLTDISPADMGTEERLEDFNYLFNIIKENYPFLSIKERRLGYNWLDLKSEFEDRISNAVDNQEFLTILFDILQALQNLHTHLVYPGDISLYRDFFNSVDLYPYNETFSEEIEFANAYWISRYWTSRNLKHGRSFEVLMTYVNGEYLLVDGYGDWVENYGNGSKVLAVDSVPIDDAIENAYIEDYLDWDFIRNKPHCWYITPQTFRPEAVFTIRNTTGHEKDVTFSYGSYVYANPLSYPVERLYTELLKDETIGYVYLQSFFNDYIEIDYPELVEFYDEIENCTHLIIDIRGNGGGNTYYSLNNIIFPLAKERLNYKSYMAFRTGDYVQYFREAIGVSAWANKSLIGNLPSEVQTDDFDLYNTTYYTNPQATTDFDGEIILLTDGFVYSAAESFASFCKHSGFATLYGSTTGGDGIGITPMYYVLPNSKLVIRISCAMGLDETGQANEEVRTQPHFVYESAYGNWSELIDYACNNLP